MENISLFVLSRCAELGKKVRLQFSRAEYFSSVYWVILIFSRAEYFSSVWWWLIHTRLNNFRSIFHPFANDCYTWLNNLRSIFHPFANDWYTNLAEQSQEWLKSAIGKICTISPSCSLILRASQHFGTFFATNHSGKHFGTPKVKNFDWRKVCPKPSGQTFRPLPQTGNAQMDNIFF